MYTNLTHFGNSGINYEITYNPTTCPQEFYNPIGYQPMPVVYADGINKKESANERLIVVDTTDNLMLVANTKSTIVTDGYTAERRFFSGREFQIAAHGTFEVLYVEKSVSNSGREVDANVVFNIVTVTGERKNAKLTYDVHMDKKVLKTFLEEKGVAVNDKFLTDVHYDVQVKIAKAQVKIVGVGFSAQLKSSAINAPDGSEIASAIDISEKRPAIVVHRVVPLVIACAVSVLSMFPDDGVDFPPVVLVNQDYQYMKKAAEKLYRTAMSAELKSASIAAEKVTLIGVETLSDYKKNVLFDSIEERLCSTLSLPIIIARNTEFLKGKTGAIILRFPAYESDFPDFLSFFHSFILMGENANKVKKVYNEVYKKASEHGLFTRSQAKFVALIFAVFETFLKALEFDGAFIEECLDELETILDKSVDATSAVDYKDAVVKFLEGGNFPISSTFFETEAPTIIVHEGCAWLPRAIVCACAEELGLETTPLVEYLKKTGTLKLANNGDRQINHRYADDTTKRFYVLKMSSLYHFGKLRLLPDKFEDEKPAVAIPIGISDGVEISLFIDKLDCESNNHISVMGMSGSGKSYFLAQLAKSAANCGISSCFISTEELSSKELEEMEVHKRYVIDEDGSVDIYQRIEYSDGSGSIFSIEVVDGDPKKLDNVLKMIYDIAKKKRTPFFLFVDEIQIFNLGDGSILFNRILRTGRKYGIMLVLSTQFLDSSMTASASAKFKQAKNYFEFRSSDTKKSLARLDVNNDDRDEAANVLKELPIGTCIARGNLMTPYCKVDYPLEVKIARVEPVFNKKASTPLLEDDIMPTIKF